MAENSFTFWNNMKEAIDVYDDAEYKYKLYDALTEYGLYGIWPEDDGTKDAKDLIFFVQSMMPSLDKSRNYGKNVTEAGAVGGRKQKVEDDQIKHAIEEAAKNKNGVPSRQEVVDKIAEIFDIKISTKTISRRCDDEEKKRIALAALKREGDKINVSGGQDMSQGHKDKIGDTINVSGTKGQNNVPESKKVGFIF